MHYILAGEITKMYRIECGNNWKFGKKYFDSKEEATNFIVDHLLREYEKSGKEVDSTFFDEIELNFEIVDGFYDQCQCGCLN
jgi:hypothetical protein